MHANRRAATATILGVALVGMTPAAHDALARPAYTQVAATAKARTANGVHLRGARGLPKFRPPRTAAAQDAARFGTLVGTECHGKADMPRNDHQWVVLCSNGKTFVVDQPPQGGAPATECSLAGTGPLPACFGE
jgi:hypothetical protein